jgi:hypothetical protein
MPECFRQRDVLVIIGVASNSAGSGGFGFEYCSRTIFDAPDIRPLNLAAAIP